MGVSILPGGDGATFDEPLEMLAACHGRIRKQLATLARLGRHLPEHGHDADARAAARAILRYFDSAALKHHEDEERSVLPRLAQRDLEARALAARIAGEHAELAARWRRLRPLLCGIAAGQRAVMPPRLVAEVAAHYDRHMELEESVLIPLARERLTVEELRTIGEEMAERRGVTVEGARLAPA
ncbi:MAG: hemerythrin domain-containing protein [Burkholderiales bacterium]|jgi:hemerythrin-like domain-containing protein|nr:hemerythrin domain-containing protein [Burkholderiales bacterium]